MNDQPYILSKFPWECEHSSAGSAAHVNLYPDVQDYLNQACAFGATSLGIASYLKPVLGMVGLEQWSAVGGIISVIGLAIVNAYSFARSTIRQHNLADAEMARETWKGKYEAAVESNEILRRSQEDLKIALSERDREIEHLRRQLRH